MLVPPKFSFFGAKLGKPFSQKNVKGFVEQLKSKLWDRFNTNIESLDVVADRPVASLKVVGQHSQLGGRTQPAHVSWSQGTGFKSCLFPLGFTTWSTPGLKLLTLGNQEQSILWIKHQQSNDQGRAINKGEISNKPKSVTFGCYYSNLCTYVWEHAFFLTLHRQSDFPQLSWRDWESNPPSEGTTFRTLYHGRG